MCSLRDANEELQKKGVKIYGVSFDAVATQKAFAEKQKLPYDLIADPEGKVVAAFGVPSRGKFASRTALLFKDGKLVWRDPKGSTTNQAEVVLKAMAKDTKRKAPQGKAPKGPAQRDSEEERIFVPARGRDLDA